MKNWKASLLACACLLALLGAAGAASAFGTKDLDDEKAAVTFAREIERGHYKIVTTQELKSWQDQKKAMLIVDTMPYADSYRKHHLPSAVPMEFPIPEVTALDAVKKAQLEKLLGPDKNRLIVFYCGFTACTRSHNGAMWAAKLGYRNIYRYPGGIKAWLQADNPVEKEQ